MAKFKKILLASHGTEGAQAAEKAALELCSSDTSIYHLIIVPDLWKGMMGDDWLNNGITRDTFGNYLESELGKEIDEHIAETSSAMEKQGVAYKHGIVVGKLDECLLEASKTDDYDLVVIGSPRPKGKTGLRSKMKLEPLAQSLSVPLFVANFPEA